MTDEDLAEVYQERNARIQNVIDVLAEEYDYDEFGRKAEIAREHGIDAGRIDYVVRKWEELIEWRHSANLSPMDSEAAQAAIEEADLEPVADGMGTYNVTFELPLNKAFRAIRLLPADLGGVLFSQVLGADAPTSELQRQLEEEE